MTLENLLSCIANKFNGEYSADIVRHETLEDLVNADTLPRGITEVNGWYFFRVFENGYCTEIHICKK